MKKKHKNFYFNLLSVVYLVTTFWVVWNFSFFSKTNIFLFIELSYVVISAIFSLFVLVMIGSFLNKIKSNNFKKINQLKIRLNLLYVLAVIAWIVMLFFQFFHSIKGITGHQLLKNVFLSNNLLDKFFIAQLSIALYLLIFIIFVFIITLIFAKSKKIIIKFNNLKFNFASVVVIIQEVRIKKPQALSSIKNLINFLKSFFQKNLLALRNLFLKIKTIKSVWLKNMKKQTMPPIFSF